MIYWAQQEQLFGRSRFIRPEERDLELSSFVDFVSLKYHASWQEPRLVMQTNLGVHHS